MSSATTPHTLAASDRAGRRAWAGLAVLALPALLASLELTVTHLALPTISQELGPSSTQLLWIVDIYAFLLAGSLITMGTLGDRIGRRRLLMIGASAFGITSALAAYSTTPEMLIATRALMGIAGATLMPSILSLVTTMFTNPRQRTTAIGLIIASVSAGTAIGPLVGGALLDNFWWGSVFLLGVPFMVLLLIAGPLLLPEHQARTGRLDLISAALSLAAIMPIVYGLKQIAADDAGWPAVLAVVAGLGFAAVFLRRQRTLADPFIDLRLFSNRTFNVALITLTFGIFVLWAANFFIAQYLQLVQGLSPLRAGLWTAPAALGVIAGSLLATRLARRVRPGLIIGTGLAVSAAGFLILTRLDASSELALLVTGSVVVSAGLGPMMALATDLVVGAAPPDRAGAASAISTTAPQLGGALGIAVLGSVITAVYRGKIHEDVPAGLPHGSESDANDNLGAAGASAPGRRGCPTARAPRGRGRPGGGGG
jgi:DHA2 family multidrug resistance protein-like MFS transporter